MKKKQLKVIFVILYGIFIFSSGIFLNNVLNKNNSIIFWMGMLFIFLIPIVYLNDYFKRPERYSIFYLLFFIILLCSLVFVMVYFLA